VHRCVVLVALAACGKHDEAPVAPPAPLEAGWTCEPLPFAASTPIPEASGAAWVTFHGKPALLVISDSGNKGAYGIIDPDSGDTLVNDSFGRMDHGDDYEGLATRRGDVYFVLSGGYVGEIGARDDAFYLDNMVYPLGPRIAEADEPRAGHGTEPPKGQGMACGSTWSQNCGRNFEGICLDDRTRYTRGPCAGFAASKADGHLYCLLEHEGPHVTYTADFARSIEVMPPGQLADCAIGEDGTLWAGGNMFSGNAVVRVDHWDDPANAKVVPVGLVGIGNSEVLAVRGDVVYRMSDMNGSPSLMAKFRCRPKAQ
jgi:hypothetical protein